MVVFPNCKINLGLSVLRKRADNFHDLQTVFYPLPFYDVLEIAVAGQYSIVQSGIALDVSAESNICARAWSLLKHDFPTLPEVKIHLHKVIPVGAGLGGGSADAAFVLTTANKKFKLGLSQEALTGYALQLGSDCPFFIYNQPALATGRGEQLTPVSVDLSRYRLVVVNPAIHVPTAKAFSMIRPDENAPDLQQVIARPVHEWKNHLVNDFENPVFSMYPEIRSLKEQLYTAGAIYASMSGSGSTVFGIFENEMSLPAFPAHYLVREL